MARLRAVPAHDLARTAAERSAFELVGRSADRLLRAAGIVRRPPVPDDLAADRLRGAVLVLCLPVAVWSRPIGLLLAAVGWHLPRLVAARDGRGSRRALDEDVVFAVELLGVCASSGATVSQALTAVAPHLIGPLGPPMRNVVASIDGGERVDLALERMADRQGEVVGPMVSLLRAAHCDGEPLVPALERLGDRLRVDQRNRATADARRLSARLVVPLVCCTLPGFVLVAVAPVVIDALRHGVR